MTDTPDDIQRKIAHLEGQRALLGDAIVDEMIARLRAQPPPAGAATGAARSGSGCRGGWRPHRSGIGT
jgi:hypothetical protein